MSLRGGNSSCHDDRPRCGHIRRKVRTFTFIIIQHGGTKVSQREEEDEGESTTTGDCVGHATRTGSMTGYCVGQTNGTRSMTGYCGGATGTIGTCVGYARGTRSMTGYGQGAARVGSSVGIMGGLEQAAKALIPTTATVPPALMSQTSKYRLLPSFN